MINTGFESRIKVQQILDSQLPDFVLDESPKSLDFFKQYYISQEYQGGPIDISDNLDQYLKLDNLTPEVIVGSTNLISDISSTSDIIQVSSTKGFPQKYGLLKIDNEIITYTDKTSTTFTGCIRGFSGVTNYHENLNYEELVFSTSDATSHSAETSVQNLSSLFLQEFYKKLKYSLTPDLQNVDFVSDLNVSNFIKESKTLYKTKGTEEAFRILFNVLFGETPKLINLEDFLIKPSSANYVKRLIVVCDVISGNPLNLEGQTIVKSTDPNTTASVSEIEIIKRSNKTYYKLLLFVGYDLPPAPITGQFNITGSTKNIETVSVGSSVITVDSTIGFPETGTIYSGDNVITYTGKSINQFFGCNGVTSTIDIASTIFSQDTYFGYENGDDTKKVVLRITGVLSSYQPTKSVFPIGIGEKIGIKNIGKSIKNPDKNKTYEEIFSNSWIYNTSSRYQIIDDFIPGTTSQIALKSSVDKSSLKVGDFVELLFRNTQTLVQDNLLVQNIILDTNNLYQIQLSDNITLSAGSRYDIRRKIKVASSSLVNFDFEPITSDIQNVYDGNDGYMYVASNSLPSYEINKSTFSYNASGVSDKDIDTNLYSKIVFSSKISFSTGDEVYYKPSGAPISGLVEGIYYVEVFPGNLEIRLYGSKSVLGTVNYLNFGDITSGTHNFTLNSQKENILSAQKILRKFPLSVDIGDGESEETPPSAIGMLVNGVEIYNYKTTNKIYYGPLEKVNVLNGGYDFDVISPPNLVLSSGSALIQPCLSGSVEKIYVTPQNFDVDVVVSVALTGGNGSGAVFQPIIERKRRELEFDARVSSSGGGVNIDTETITFLTDHNLTDGEEIIYRPLNNQPIGIETFLGPNNAALSSLVDEASYYAKYVNNVTIRLYPSFSDYNSGINTIGFTTSNASGIQKFVTKVKNTLSQIKVIDGGEKYKNRKLRVSQSGISTTKNTIYFSNHGFEDGEKIRYSTTGSALSGLSTQKEYYVLKIDDDFFRLSDAGIGGTDITNYNRRKFVGLGSTVSNEYHIFSDPEISLKVKYSSVGLNTSQIIGTIEAIPVVKGEITNVYVYDKGSDYGSTILNYHKKPSIIIENGKEAQCKPIIQNGKIIDVAIQYSGRQYYSTPTINIIDSSGNGKGAILRPVITNNKLSDVIIINGGTGYSNTDTKIEVIPSGAGSFFDPNVRELTVNDNFLLGTIHPTDDYKIPTNEIIKSSYNNLQYGVLGYFDTIKNEFDDNGLKHSPIVGWAYDGNPIYGSYGYSDPKNLFGDIKKLTSGYSLNIDNVFNRPSGFSSGFFVEDYKFTNSGDLDEYNGRFCVTNEFPDGTYAYFATSEEDAEGNTVGVFPYFIGNKFRSKFVEENRLLNQKFDFDNSELIRNTFPYKIGDLNASNDFIIESNEIIDQFSVVESVTSGSIEEFEIINSGDNYKVGESLNFDESGTNGAGLIVTVDEITGKEIVNLESSPLSYSDVIFEWESKDKIKVKISPNHNLSNLDYVNISGLSTSLGQINGIARIGVTSYSSSLFKDIPSLSVGLVTDIYLSNIPESIAVNSNIKIGSDTLSILNIFNNQNILRVISDSAVGPHTATTPVYFIPDSFTISKSVNYFDSKTNDLVYFNPNYSIGVGTISGTDVSVPYNVGVQTNNTILVPTQSIYLPNHPFKTNQEIILTKPPSGGSNISVSNTSTSATFDLPTNGNSQTVYVIRKSADFIGIVTQVGLTTTSKGLFFRSFATGLYDNQYSFKSKFDQVKGSVDKRTATVSVSTAHNLNNNDVINLNVKPNLSVGIGTSTSVKVLREENTGYLLFNPLTFSSSGVNTSKNTITINSHKLKTGDKVKYSANSTISGLSNNFYFVYKVDDNTIKLSETYIDVINTNPPNTIALGSTGGSTQSISAVNPPLNVIRNNDLVFDLSDSSLSGYQFKLFYDQNFSDEFVSTGSTSAFSVIGIGTIGVSTNASVKISYNDYLPSPLFYGLEKSGYISVPDKEVINYSKINYVNSVYNNSYTVFGVGTTTFNICLLDLPEKSSYQQSECETLEYTTSSSHSLGGVSKLKVVSPGSGFKQLPIFDGINSEYGSGAYIIPNSSKIGKVNEIRILNEGFEYSSDRTLTPEASVPKFISIRKSNTISSVEIVNSGYNYIYPPDLVIIDSDTGELINSGSLIANLSNAGSIESVTIDYPPKGLTETLVTVRSINNTNGVSIKTVQSSSSGIVTCIILSPSLGFGNEPFSVGDKIFVEGIQKETSDGSGFNSKDYGYQFFTVTAYTASSPTSSAVLTYNLSGLTTNPGIAKSIENDYGTIINYKNYPSFNVIQDFSLFTVGENLQVKIQEQFIDTDLVVTDSSKNYIKVSGSYHLEVDQIIKGKQSSSVATINTIKENLGQFNINYGNITDLGWYDDIGKLNQDNQVIANNDYYQNLSYSVKSSKEWKDIVSPVNNIVHPSGLKNFADTQIIGIVTTNSITVNPSQFLDPVLSLVEQKRVDTIKDFDLVKDTNTFGGRSKSLILKNKKLSSYFKVTSNRVLSIDDISDQFSSSDREISPSSKIINIDRPRKFNQYLVQISDKNYDNFQFTEIITLNNDSEMFTFQKGTINSSITPESGYETNLIGDVYGYINDQTEECYLKFDPTNPFASSYNIKYLYNTFTNYNTSIGSTNIGYVTLSGVTTTVSSGSTINLIEKSTSELNSVHSLIHTIDNTTGEMNYVELFVDHNGTDTNIAEFYLDTDNGLSSNFIGTFRSYISGGIIKLEYSNTTGNSVTIRSKNVGFSTISVGIQTYRFKQEGQPDGFENTVKFISSYNQNVSTACTFISLNKDLFSSVKSTVKVSVGETSALHQIMVISDGTNVNTMQYPFISIGSTLGIGSFSGEISGTELILKFYPDSTFLGNNIDLITFNQVFFVENDYLNTPPNLQYSNILESVGVSRFISINDEDINKKDFILRYKNTPIFAKTFNPSDSSILNPSTGIFEISDHFFSTGEELIYTPKSSFNGVVASSVGIVTTLDYAGFSTNILPEKVFAIKINNDRFKIATRKEYALSGIGVTFTSFGSGNAHELQMSKKNEKCIITINNIVQEPISYALLDYQINNGSQVGSSATIFGLSGISSIKLGDILKVDNEYMKITNVGLGTTYSGPITFSGLIPLVNVERGYVGSSATVHANAGIASIYRGSFNIVGNYIYFTEAPDGSLEDQIFPDLDGLPESRDYFSGRVFLRKKYDENKVYDNISEQFTGIGQTYRLTVGGANTTGLGTDGSSGLVFINGVFQSPTTQNNKNNNFSIIENQISGISSIVFSGITSSNGSIIISNSDVNLNQLPRGGLIVSLGSTGGLGYAPLVGASVTAVIGAGGTIVSIGIGTTGDTYSPPKNWGSGYRSPISVAVTESGHTGLAATITATVGAGGTLSFNVISGGTGYTNPTINISSPSYSNLPIIGVSRLSTGSTTDCGVGILLDIDVGASSTTGIGSTLFEVTAFKIKRSGYGFKPGDVFKPVGLVTARGLSSPITEFQLTVLDTFTDSFSSWQFGQIDYIDSIKEYQDGSRVRFPLYYNGNLLSFEKDSSNSDSQVIDLSSLLIIFINGILQTPDVAYQFDGGTSFTFTNPPKENDNVAIYFYRGSSEDSSQVNVIQSLKIGDNIQVFSNNNYLGITTTQSLRTVSDISTSDRIETILYADAGIDENIYKPLSWTKQKTDRIINGEFISKSRESIEPRIYPTSKIIKSFDQSSNEIFVDSIELFNYEGKSSGEIDFNTIIVSGAQDPVSAAVTAVVSFAGTIQSLTINNVGSGYTGSSIEAIISNPPAVINGFGESLTVTNGTTATASISIINGSLSTVSITNPGSGYTNTNPPQVLIPPPSIIYENIENVTAIAGTIGNITGIGTTTGVGTALAINFTMNLTGLSTGYPIYVSNTKVGNGVTSILNNNSQVVGVGTSCLDNIYIISGINASTGVVTCNIHSQSSIVGIATTGLVGRFSWGKISAFSRSSSPISIGVSGFTVDSGLSTFPSIQRRSSGFNDEGPIAIQK